MMDKKSQLWVAGGLSVTALVGFMVYSAHKKKQDEQAGQFYSELERQISPGDTNLANEPAFDMNYWINLAAQIRKPYITLKSDAALNFAKTIHNAWSVVNDDEAAIYGVYRALQDKVQASQVAWMYYTAVNKKVNLIDDLRSRLNSSEVGQIVQIVNALPAYRLGSSPRLVPTKPVKKK